MSPKSFRHTILLLVPLIGLVSLFSVLHWYLPSITDVTVTYESTGTHPAELPISFPSIRTDMDFSMKIHASPLTPILWRIHADDCLTRLTLNGIDFPESIFDPCYVDRAMDYSFEGIIIPGENILAGTVQDTGGSQGLSLRVSHKDPFYLVVRLWFIFFLLLFFYALLLYIPAIQRDKWLGAAILAGVAIRLAYFDVTPIDARGNDIWGHIDYLRHMWTHWNIPPVHGGWQFYQPPLYYFVTSLFALPVQWLALSEQSLLRVIQFSTTVLSSASLLLLIPISSYLFPDTTEKKSRLLWMALVVTAPILVFVGTQLNNDAFIIIFGIAVTALLLHFWHTGSLIAWHTSIIIIGLALLTKSNAILLIPAALLTLACYSQLPRRRRLLHLFVSVLVLFSMTFWLHVHRMGEDPDLKMVGNIESLHSGLIVPNTMKAYTMFRPLKIIKDPFAQTWSGEGRGYFWEYYFHSALSGEYIFTEFIAVSRTLVTLGLAVLLLILIGFFRRSFILWENAAPLIMIGFFLISGHIIFRLAYPYASSQHFRYTAPVFLLIAYLAVRASEVLPTKLKLTAKVVLWSFVIVATVHTLLIGRY